ncbi:MAG: CheR family methyltransferase [Candidatus Eisenbacteria bacterium]
MSDPRFLADDMLARLARWLRGAGLDVSYAGGKGSDDELLLSARRERRIVLTRDSRFPGGDGERIILESADLDDQLVEVLRRFPSFDPLARPFSRCMECNGQVREELDPPDRPTGVAGPFTRCEECGRLFWAGTHVERVRERLSRVVERLEGARKEERDGAPPPLERAAFDAFLREAFGLLGFSWRGYRRVRFGLRTRVRRRLRELGLSALDDYLERVRRDPEERLLLGSLLNVTVSRFFRDRGLWLRFPETLFPRLAARASGGAARVFSLGCASGEEPFTLRMIWNESTVSGIPLEILAADVSEACLRRAREAVYPGSAVHNVPEPFRHRYFREAAGDWTLAREVADSVRFERFDWRSERWPGPFHWILARNGVFTYLAEEERRRALAKIRTALEPGGFLWIGGNEKLPQVPADWEVLAPGLFLAGEVPGP